MEGRIVRPTTVPWHMLWIETSNRTPDSLTKTAAALYYQHPLLGANAHYLHEQCSIRFSRRVPSTLPLHSPLLLRLPQPDRSCQGAPPAHYHGPPGNRQICSYAGLDKRHLLPPPLYSRTPPRRALRLPPTPRLRPNNPTISISTVPPPLLVLLVLLLQRSRRILLGSPRWVYSCR